MDLIRPQGCRGSDTSNPSTNEVRLKQHPPRTDERTESARLNPKVARSPESKGPEMSVMKRPPPPPVRHHQLSTQSRDVTRPADPPRTPAVSPSRPPIPRAAIPPAATGTSASSTPLSNRASCAEPVTESGEIERLLLAVESDDDSSARGREAQHLVEAARSGDPRAFEALFRRYRPRIFALALHMTGSPSDADDITQDAFVRAYRNIDRFEGRSEFFTWLYRIALNRALNVRRDRTRRRTEDVDDPRVTVAIAVDAKGDPHRALELRQTYSHLVRAFDRLSPLLKTTVALTMMQGLSYPEAAVVLETTEGTIAWRIHEARKQMRNALDTMLADPNKAVDPLPEIREATRRKAPIDRPTDRNGNTQPSALEMALALLAPSV